MTGHITTYPLAWPPGKVRTKTPQPSRFGTNSWSHGKRISLARAIDELNNELSLLGAKNEVLSSNLKLRLDGLPYSNQRTPDDPGIAVYFDLSDGGGKMRPVCMACDRWNKQACNVWSIAKCVSALRGLDRWGGGDMVHAAFTGFVALPAPAVDPWWSVLGYDSEAHALDNDFERQSKRLMQKTHPDNQDTGDEWMFKKIVEARKIGRMAA